MSRSPWMLSLVLCLWSSAPAAGNLIVIEDRGGASALPYYEDLGPEANGSVELEAFLDMTVAGAFPVRSDQLSPGREPGRPLDAPGLQPIFLVGDDPLSRRWLHERSPQLRQLQAVGLAVNVANAARLQEIRRWANDLPVLPISADDLALRLDLKHYPVLITPTAIQQ